MGLVLDKGSGITRESFRSRGVTMFMTEDVFLGVVEVLRVRAMGINRIQLIG